MDFEWDEHKREANIAKHGIDFLRALTMFDGRPAVDITSSTVVATEPRFLRVAILDERYWTTIWTRREPDMVRIISVRRSRDGEQRAYRQIFG